MSVVFDAGEGVGEARVSVKTPPRRRIGIEKRILDDIGPF